MKFQQVFMRWLIGEEKQKNTSGNNYHRNSFLCINVFYDKSENSGIKKLYVEGMRITDPSVFIGMQSLEELHIEYKTTIDEESEQILEEHGIKVHR